MDTDENVWSQRIGRFYIHRVNPHYAATHHDFWCEGWEYVTTQSSDYPIELAYPWCLYKHGTLEAAIDTTTKLDAAYGR